MFAIFILEVVNGFFGYSYICDQSHKRLLYKLLFNLVLPDTLHILDKEALFKPKAQDRPKVFNLVMAKRTEIALVGNSVLQFVNLLILWLHPLSTVVTVFIRN